MCWEKESAGGSRFGTYTDTIKPGKRNPFLCCMVAPRVVSLSEEAPARAGIVWACSPWGGQAEVLLHHRQRDTSTGPILKASVIGMA